MKRISHILWVIAFIFAAVFVVRNILGGITLFQDKLSAPEQAPIVLSVTPKEPALPGPLVASTSPTSRRLRPSAMVSAHDVITLTNVERTSRGLAALGENTTLDKAALYKAKDILKRQYFAHTAPGGETMSTIVTANGYEYLVVGENLALGNFASSSALVTAWMNSPGHRENILNGSYREIGVGIATGLYEKQLSIVGVQVFATPRAACPMADSTTKQKLIAQEAALTAARTALDELKNELDQLKTGDSGLYNQKVEEFNKRVVEYNGFVERQKEAVTEYNKTIAAANECIQRLQ